MVNPAGWLSRYPTLRTGSLPSSRVWSKQTNAMWKTFFSLGASLGTKWLLRSQKGCKNWLPEKRKKCLTFYYIQPQNNLFSVFQIAISIFQEKIVISFLALLQSFGPKLKMFSKLHLSVCFWPCSCVVIHFLRLEILKVNVQDLPQRLKLLLQEPFTRKLMFIQGDIAITFFSYQPNVISAWYPPNLKHMAGRIQSHHS